MVARLHWGRVLEIQACMGRLLSFFSAFSHTILCQKYLLLWSLVVIIAFRIVMMQTELAFSAFWQQSAHQGFKCYSISDPCSLAVQFSSGIAMPC